jgi:hypothetical protein
LPYRCFPAQKQLFTWIFYSGRRKNCHEWWELRH